MNVESKQNSSKNLKSFTDDILIMSQSVSHTNKVTKYVEMKQVKKTERKEKKGPPSRTQKR